MKYFLFLLLLLCSASSNIDFSPEYIIDFKADLSEEIGRENISERLEYERLISADPKTGQIPPNIRNLELSFARQISIDAKKVRTQALDVSSAGPFNVGGRTRAVAFDVRDENIIIAGGVSGGIWKSIDGGISWVRKSNPENRNSISCLTQDKRPGKEDTWYHGTGELVGNSAAESGAPFRGAGIYKSIDNGETWNVLPSTVDSSPTVFNSQFQYIWSIEVNNQNVLDDEVLVAAYGGILKSMDGGTSWDVELGQKLFDLAPDVDLNDSDASFYTDIEQGPTGIFFATLSKFSVGGVSPEAGIYVSADGDSWFDINPFTAVSNFRRVVIGPSPSNPNQVYFLVEPAFLMKYTIQSIDESGVNGFFDIDKVIPSFEPELGDYNSQNSYNMMIRVHPTNDDIVFIGGTNLYRSTDGFDTKENTKWIGGYTPKGGNGLYPNHHPDQHDLLFYPSNPDKILSASDGGLIVSDAGLADSVRWRSLNNGFLTSQFFTVAQSKEANDPIILGGMQDNGTDLTSSTGSANWRNLIGGDGGYAATTRNKVLWYSAFQKGQTFRLTLDNQFNITTFRRVDPGNLVAQEGSEYLFINPYILDPANQNRMFIAGGNHLYVNDNVAQIPGGTQDPATLGWKRITQVEDSLFVGSLSALEMTADGSRLYFGSGGGQVLKVENADNYNQFSVSQLDVISMLPEFGFVSCITVNPEDNDHILAIFSNYNIPSIFESLDGGATFTDVSGNLEENVDGTGNGPSVRWGEIIPLNTGNLFVVGTSTGLYSTELLDGNQTIWTRESSDVVGSAVIPMMDYRPSDGKLAIATHGNGVFTAQIADFKEISTEIESALFAEVKVYPNPFQETTEINFSIPEDGEVRIDIFSMKGEHISNLLWAPQFAGTNSPVTWDGRTSAGASLANGIYLYKIQYNGQSRTGKIILRR